MTHYQMLVAFIEDFYKTLCSINSLSPLKNTTGSYKCSAHCTYPWLIIFIINLLHYQHEVEPKKTLFLQPMLSQNTFKKSTFPAKLNIVIKHLVYNS